MQEDHPVLEDATGTPLPEEGKAKKFFRIAFAVVSAAFFVVLIVAAAMKRFGS
jgi:hypothetical protein